MYVIQLLKHFLTLIKYLQYAKLCRGDWPKMDHPLYLGPWWSEEMMSNRGIYGVFLSMLRKSQGQ